MTRLIITLALALLSFAAGAQTLTPQQRATLAADIAASPTLAQLRNDGNLGGLAGHYNGTDATWVVWRTSASVDDIMRNGMDWARVDNLSVGKARIWDWMGRLGTLNCSRPNIRAGIDATWVGTAADLAVRATVYTHCKRAATRFERLFSSGPGSDASPATMGTDAVGAVIEGQVGAGLFEALP